MQDTLPWKKKRKTQHISGQKPNSTDWAHDSTNRRTSTMETDCAQCSQPLDRWQLKTHYWVTMATATTVTSTRWLSGPYKSLSSSITRLLKNEENLRFTFPGSLTFVFCNQHTWHVHKISKWHSAALQRPDKPAVWLPIIAGLGSQYQTPPTQAQQTSNNERQSVTLVQKQYVFL